MNKRRFAKVLVFLTALLGSLTLGQTTFADTITKLESHILIQQQFESNKSNANSLFTYQLEAVNEGAPLPMDQSIYEFTMKDSTITKIPITFYQPGVYHYQIRQIIPREHISGYTYDSRQLSIEAYVSYAQNQQLTSIIIVKNEKGEKLDSTTFENSFSDPKIIDNSQDQNNIDYSKSQKMIEHSKDKGILPKMGEEASFLLSVIGMGCIWLVFLLMIYLKKLDDRKKYKLK